MIMVRSPVTANALYCGPFLVRVSQKDIFSQDGKYLAAREALLANLNLQDRLKDTLEQLELSIHANSDQQAKIQAAALQMNRSGWYSGLRGKSSSP